MTSLVIALLGKGASEPPTDLTFGYSQSMIIDFLLLEGRNIN